MVVTAIIGSDLIDSVFHHSSLVCREIFIMFFLFMDCKNEKSRISNTEGNAKAEAMKTRGRERGDERRIRRREKE